MEQAERSRGSRASGTGAARPSGAIRAAVAAERRRWWRLIGLMSILVIVIGIAVHLPGRIAAGPSTPVPPELLGTWTTEDPRYAGRAIQFGVNLVIFRLGDESGTYPVHRVRRARDGESTRYSIIYLDGTEEVTLSLRYRRAPAPVLTLANPADVTWRRP